MVPPDPQPVPQHVPPIQNPTVDLPTADLPTVDLPTNDLRPTNDLHPTNDLRPTKVAVPLDLPETTKTTAALTSQPIPSRAWLEAELMEVLAVA
jgi:hypothetical protein